MFSISILFCGHTTIGLTYAFWTSHPRFSFPFAVIITFTLLSVEIQCPGSCFRTVPDFISLQYKHSPRLIHARCLACILCKPIHALWLISLICEWITMKHIPLPVALPTYTFLNHQRSQPHLSCAPKITNTILLPDFPLHLVQGLPGWNVLDIFSPWHVTYCL